MNELFQNVAVAGGFGFLGSRVVETLQAWGYRATPFSRRSGVDIRNFQETLDYIRGQEFDVVINCAAHVGGIEYNRLHPVEVYQDNLAIGHNLLRSCVEAGTKKFVNIMPNCTYPGYLDIYKESEWWNGPMHDTVQTYGMPRKALWVEAWAYKQISNFNSIHLILPNLYGPGDHFDPVRSHALGAIVKKVMDAKNSGKKTVEIWGTGSPIREWGYVADAAEGVVRAMEKYEDINVMNVGEGKGYTIRRIAELIRDSADWEGDFTYDSSKPDGAPKKVLDVSRMKCVLGWEPRTGIANGIGTTINWYQSNMVRTA